MLLTSDGKAFVYGVFVADGYECVDFQSLHADEESANVEAVRLRADPDALNSQRATVEVQMLEVRGQYAIHDGSR